MGSSVGGVNVPITGNSAGFKKAMAGAQAATKKFGASTVALNRKLKKVGKSMTSMGKNMTMGLTAPIAALGVVAVKSFEEQIAAEKRLENAVGGAATALKAQAAELQKVTRFGDEATMAVQGQLATLGLTEDQILKLTPLVQDLSARTGKDLAKSAKEVTSALSTGSTTLAKYGVELTASNTMAENFDITMAGLTESVGGQAKVLANEGVGPLVMMQNAMGDLMEQFGEIIVVAIKPFVTWIKDLAIRFQELSPETKKIIVIVAALVAGIGPLLLALGFLASTVLPAVATGFTIMMGPIGLIIAAIGVMAAVIYTFWDEIVSAFMGAKAAIFKIGENIVNGFKQIPSLMLEAFKEFPKAIMDVFKDVGALIKAVLTGDFKAIPELLKSAGKNLVKSNPLTGAAVKIGKLFGAGVVDEFVGTFSSEMKSRAADIEKETEKVLPSIVSPKATAIPSAPTAGGSGTKKINEQAEAYKKVSKSISDATAQAKLFGESEVTVAAKMDILRSGINSAIIEFGANSKAVQAMKMDYDILAAGLVDTSAKQERLNEISKVVSSEVAGAFDSLANGVISSLQLADDGFGRFIKGLVGTITKLISMMLASSISQSIAGATSSGTATGPAAVFTTPAFIATAVGGVLAAFAAIPKFAKGGLVTGATLGMVGEGRGTTASNPEVIAPLDKLKGMMGGGRVEFIIEGDKLRGVLANTNSNSSFTSPTTVFN